MIEDRKSTSLVHLNAKIESVNIEHLDYGGAEIAEGRFIVEDGTTGKVRFAAAGALGTGDMYAFLNWLDTEAGTVKDEQRDYFDETAPTITQGTGGMAGLIGSGIQIGIHKKHWDVNTNYDPARNQVVAVGSDGKPKNFTTAGANKIAADVPFFGVITRIREDVIYFNFHSAGKTLGV